MDIFFKGGVITVAKKFNVGDMPPDGYLDHEEWWNVQKKGGLKQVQCACGKYCFPQELSGKTKTFKGKNNKGKTVEINIPICKECEKVN